jgi:hypothetical protein
LTRNTYVKEDVRWKYLEDRDPHTVFSTKRMLLRIRNPDMLQR